METVSNLFLNPPLWVFLLAAGAVAVWRWRHKPARNQAFVVFIGLALMALPHTNLWEFGIWVCAAYLADMVGDDAAPGTLLAFSALFYPLTELGFNPWWCQLGANLFGIAALGVIGGMGSGILADSRFSRPSGTDFMGRVWSSFAS